MDSKPIFSALEEWAEQQLFALPESETDYFEYKSSLIPFERLKKEICVAASAFWNSGGGMLLVGINDKGQVDGGIPMNVGGQRLRDWVDQVVSQVEPGGPYIVHTIEKSQDPSPIQPGHVVLIILFAESSNVPHMAPDYRYYVRAGTHSLPAGHFLVEAIRSRRGLQKPFLRGLLRMHENKASTIQLVVLATNEAPALDVHIWFEPPPPIFQEIQVDFPLLVPMIDRNNAFAMDLLTRYKIAQFFGSQPVSLKMRYEDIAGRIYEDSQILDPHRSLSPMQVGNEDLFEINKSFKEMVRQMKRFNRMLEKRMLGRESSEKP